MTNHEAIQFLNNMIGEEHGRSIGAGGFYRELCAYHVDALRMAIKALEQEPCEDAISRRAMLDGLASIAKAKAKSDAQKSLMGRVMFFTERLPSVNPQEPKTGHWIERPEIKTSAPEYFMFYECSECGDKQRFCKLDIHKKHFCNYCGAKMIEPQESEGKDGNI